MFAVPDQDLSFRYGHLSSAAVLLILFECCHISQHLALLHFPLSLPLTISIKGDTNFKMTKHSHLPKVGATASTAN